MEETNDLFWTGSSSGKLSILRAIGVGGAGSNVVNRIQEIGIKDVTLVVCNTDKQALDASPVDIKVQLGKELTKCLGAGNNPEAGRQSALESLRDIEEILNGAEMVFITAGMGGGTGTGAAPVIAKAAKDKGILTIGVVSIPFLGEGKPRIRAAINGIKTMQECVDSLLIVNSERLNDLYSDMTLSESFHKANGVLAMATRGIAEIITRYSLVNLDLADVRTAMKDSGTAIMGTGVAGGDNRAADALNIALNSPLLNFNDIRDARHVLANIRCSRQHEILQRELAQILNTINERCNNENEANVMWGVGYDDDLDDKLDITIVATGFPKDAAFDPDMKDSDTVRFGIDGSIEKTAEEERPNRIQLTPHNSTNDDEINRLYATPEKVELRRTAQLSDPHPVPLEKLEEKETLQRIEEIPAYERRSNNK